jgi:WD40 repeat protein
VRVFSLFSPNSANEKDKKIGRGHSETQLLCALVAEVKDAHAPGAAVDALAFAGRGAKKTLFSAARDGTLCAIENENENERERFRASRRVRVGATGARASLAASPCGGYVLVAACAGSLGAAATGGVWSSSHVLVFDAETLVLKPPAMRNARGGVAALAASRRTRTSSPRDRQTVTNDDDSSSSSDERSFSVFVAGDDAAAVVSRHNFDASWRANETVCVDGQNNCEASLEPSTPLSAASLVRTAAEPISVLRDAHAPTRLARLKRHVKDAGDKEDGGGVLAATLGVAVHPAGHVVVTCGADGTLLVSPANAFADQPERIYDSFGGSAEDWSESETGAATDLPRAQRFVGAHAGAARGVTFLPTDDPAGDSLLATVGEGRVLCVWDVHAAALGALEKNMQTVTEKKQGKSRRGAFAATSRARAFGLAPTPTSVDAEAVSSHTKTQTSRSPFPSRLGETRAARAAPASAGYARAPPEPWTEPEPEPEPERLKNHERRLEGDSDDTDERENAFKKISAAFPSRVVGLAVGASAASAERTENAAAVAAAAAAPGALYVPELGALIYAAGAEVVIERVGSAKTQAVLRDPPLNSAPIGTTSRPTITALARHADSRRLASASPCVWHGDHDATIKVWDSGTGALLFTATHDACGGAVSALAFSPDGDYLLSLGGDPDGAVRVFSVPTFVRRDENEVKQPEKKPSRKTLVPAFKLATSQPVAAGAWLSPDAFFVVGAEGAAAYFFGGETSSGNDHDHDHDRSVVSKTVPFRFEDESGAALDRTPVCTAATALLRDGREKNAEAFLGDSRGRVWFCDVPTDFFGAESGVSASPGLGLTFRPLRGANAGVPLAALPRGEAATTLAAFTDATGVGVFVGSARRARVLFSEHPLRGTVALRERNARYWYELGELALDGAVTSSHATTFVSGGGRGESMRTAHAKLVTATTSAGTAWAVDTRTGNAKALLNAHAVDVADATSRGDALATVTTDGAARVWETSTFAKALEVFPDTREEPRCVTAALCGERVALAREDGTVRVVDFASRYSAKSNGVPRWHTEDVVASKTSYAFVAHPGGGAIVAVAFVESLRDTDRNVPNAQAPLVSVATDGSVAVTEFFPNEDEEKGERLFGEGSAHTIPARTKTTTVVPGGPGGVLPVRAAAFEDGVFPARVAAARDDAARVFSLRRIASGALSASTDDAFATPRFAASLTFEHAPERRFEAFETVGESARDDVPGSNQGRSACVAWSAANAGVLYYAAAATGGHLLVLDARQGFKAFDGGELPLAEARTSVVKLPFPSEPGDSHGSHRTRCVAVASSRRGCAGDLIAVGGDRGCVFLEIAARDTAGFASKAGGAENIKNREPGDGVSFSFETAPRRTSFFASQKPVVSVAWRDPSLHTAHFGFGFGTRNDTDGTLTAFVAAGADVYAFDDDALFRE